MSELKFYEIKGDQPYDQIAIYEDNITGAWVMREDAERLETQLHNLNRNHAINVDIINGLREQNAKLYDDIVRLRHELLNTKKSAERLLELFGDFESEESGGITWNDRTLSVLRDARKNLKGESDEWSQTK